MTRYDRAVGRPLEYEFRANPDGSETFAGYAAVFDSDSEPLPFIESIAPSAFDRTLSSGHRKQFVVNHEDSQLISSTATGRLRMAPDTTGLHVESPIGNTSWGRDVRTLADDGELWGMSFSFRATKDGEEWAPDYSRRRLTDVQLYHVTVLTGHEPAYHATSGRLQIRSLAEKFGATPEETEELIETLTAGRALTEEQVALLARYPTAATVGSGVGSRLEPAARLLDKWAATFAEKAPH